MSFTPLVPMGGYAGWAFLKRTMETQQQAFQAAPVLQRDEEYFREKIGSISSAEELVADRRLLKVALGAFGLDADINNKFFVKKVLEDGTLDKTDLANRLSDKQYLAMSQAFGFGDYTTPRTKMSDFADGILDKYRTRQFEIAVGEQNSDMRLAMNAARELPALAEKTTSDNAKWYSIMGSEPLRKVFQGAFGLPASFAAIDIDQQLGVLKDKAASVFGDSSAAQFSDPETVDKLIRRFMALSQTTTGIPANAKGAGALQILQGGGSAAGILSILG